MGIYTQCLKLLIFLKTKNILFGNIYDNTLQLSRLFAFIRAQMLVYYHKNGIIKKQKDHRKKRRLCMKIKLFLALALAAVTVLALSGCGGLENKTVTIAVVGDTSTFYPAYKEGIEKAVEDINLEYAGTGYSVVCGFYSDNGSYDQGAAIIDKLASDAGITGIIAPLSMELSKTAAYTCEQMGKLFVVPYFLYDSVYKDNSYDMVFSMSNSGGRVGSILRRAAAATPAKRWAVCADNREFEMSEISGFLQEEAVPGDIRVVDCENISALSERFDEVYDRWEALNVEGIVMFPQGTEGFALLKKLKQKNPELVIAGDTAFDQSNMLEADPELKSAMAGFILAEEFVMNEETPEETEILEKFQEDYRSKTGKDLDTWYIQGYNALRMIADTAIKNETTNPAEIARYLHEKGYKGVIQEFHFDQRGAQIESRAMYSVFGADGEWTDYTLAD